MQKFLDIFMNVVIVLMIIFCIYLGLNKFVFNKSEDKDYSYNDIVNNFDGVYVTNYYEVNYSHFIVQKYILALKNNDIENLNNYLSDNIKIKDKSISNIAGIVGDAIYINEVKQNSNKTEFLITYSTMENKEDTNTMLCKIDIEKQTFLICYDSLLNKI